MNALIDLGKCREYLTVCLDNQDYIVKLSGTFDNPYFCGNDACIALGYKNVKKALLTHVKSKHKKELKSLVGPAFLGSIEPLTYNEGKAVYISEPGLYSLINGSQAHKNKKEIKDQFERWINDHRYGSGSGLQDIFSFVKGYNLTFDIESKWFKDLWYPLSKSRPPLQGGPERVENQPIIVTQNLLEWMGYKGRSASDKQDKFCKTLRSFEIPHFEIGYKHKLAIEYPCVQQETRMIPKQY